MDNYSIKSVTFGGFDKQDVIRYIEETVKAAAATEKELQEKLEQIRIENQELLSRLNSAEKELASLQTRFQDLNLEYSRVKEDAAREAAARLELEPLKPLQEEVNRLRPDAEAYAQFREKIGAIECEARKRAADLESATIQKLQQNVDLFREQYQVLMSSFESTAAHVTSELRKVEVNLTQLPRTMDQPGSELNELMNRLENMKNAHQ